MVCICASVCEGYRLSQPNETISLVNEDRFEKYRFSDPIWEWPGPCNGKCRKNFYSNSTTKSISLLLSNIRFFET